jgi:hypothetical protein
MLAGLLAVSAGAPLLAQDREPQQEPDLPSRGEHTAADYEEPPHAIELALSGDGLWLTYRTGLHRGKGYGSLGLFLGTEDDVVLQGQLMRYGEPRADVPFGVGVGLGFFGAEVDETNDEVYAITLAGGADYALDRLFGFTYPTRIGFEVSWAPDLATFGDGERVLDLLARVEADLSTWATAFVGYRHLEVDLANEDDAELDSAFQIGVRLGF